MSSPSEQLLIWLRDIITRKKMNSAGVASMTGLDKGRVRKILAGQEPMMVDELLTICSSLNVTPSDMGLGAEADTVKATNGESSKPSWHLDPFGNHPRQLFEMGFALGCDFLFLAKTDDLEDSQIPEKVRAQHAGRNMAIRLDAAYHQYNEPEYYDEGVQLTLSFDALYRCRFSWEVIIQFVFFPESAETNLVPTPPPEDPEPEEKPTHLRLIK